jgi:hypothetical protein
MFSGKNGDESATIYFFRRFRGMVVSIDCVLDNGTIQNKFKKTSHLAVLFLFLVAKQKHLKKIGETNSDS